MAHVGKSGKLEFKNKDGEWEVFGPDESREVVWFEEASEVGMAQPSELDDFETYSTGDGTLHPLYKDLPYPPKQTRQYTLTATLVVEDLHWLRRAMMRSMPYREFRRRRW